MVDELLDGNATRSLRVDLHSHTRASRDALTTPAQLVERARAVGLDRIAVTDHGEIDGALEARSLDPERVIVGQEIRCRCGTELIGLFLTERISMGLPAGEASARIRAQGGLIYAPHPFAYPRHPARHAAAALSLADLVETFNSRAFWPAWNRTAHSAAVARGLPGFAGSDAHFPWEIGRAWTLVAPFSNAAGLLTAAMAASPRGLRTASPAIHVASIMLRCARAILHDTARGPVEGSRPRPESTLGGN